MAIIVPISSSWDPKGIEQAVKDINKAGQKLNAISTNTQKTNDSLGSFGNTVKKLGLTIAATFSAKEIGQFFAESIKGAIEDEKSLRVLNKTLQNMGFAGAAGQVDNFISKLQFSAGIADDELRPALNNLVLATGNLSKSQQLLNVALNVSAGTGRDLDTITVALAKAYNGNFTALKKLNLGIDESLIKNKDLSGILDVLSQKFAGASANAVDTYAGRIKILKLAVGEAQETIGYALLNALEKVTGNTQNFAGEIQNLGQDVADIIGGITTFTLQIKDLAVGLGLASYESKSLMDETITLGDRILQMIPIVGTYLKLWKDAGKAERFANMPANASPAGSRLAQQARENQKALQEQTKATDAAKKAQEELKKNTQSLIETNKSFASFVAGQSPKSIQGATALANTALADIQKLMSKHPKINDALVKSFQSLATTVQNNFSFAIDQAKSKLEEAKQKYNQFKDSIKGSITSIVNFGNQTEGLSFVANLQMQAEQAKKFGGQIATLMQMGLNQSALQQIASAGYQTGSVIAQEIINGGSTVVNMVNQLVSSVDQVAEQVSTSMANQFYGAGVDAAQSLVDGLIQRLNESAAIIAQAIANATAGNTTTNPDAGKKKKPKKSTITPPRTATKPMNRFARGLAARASGGPVTAGFPYLVGERGPELFMPSTGGSIVPNSRTASGSNINITVNAGMGTNGALVGKQIVEAIKKYEKTSGQVFQGA